MTYANAKRRNRERNRPKWGGGPFIALPRRFAESQTLAGLSPSASKLLLDLIAAYRGFNNGNFAITWSQMRRRGWRSKATLKKATDELLERRIAIRTRHGGRRACHLYALTIWDIDECDGKLEIGPTDKPLNSWLHDESLRPLHELQQEFRKKQEMADRKARGYGYL